MMGLHFVVQERIAPPVAASTVSVVTAFHLHEVLGTVGQIIGILSGLASLGWVCIQIIRERNRK